MARPTGVGWTWTVNPAIIKIEQIAKNTIMQWRRFLSLYHWFFKVSDKWDQLFGCDSYPFTIQLFWHIRIMNHCLRKKCDALRCQIFKHKIDIERFGESQGFSSIICIVLRFISMSYQLKTKHQDIFRSHSIIPENAVHHIVYMDWFMH